MLVEKGVDPHTGNEPHSGGVWPRHRQARCMWGGTQAAWHWLTGPGKAGKPHTRAHCRALQRTVPTSCVCGLDRTPMAACHDACASSASSNRHGLRCCCCCCCLHTQAAQESSASSTFINHDGKRGDDGRYTAFLKDAAAVVQKPRIFTGGQGCCQWQAVPHAHYA